MHTAWPILLVMGIALAEPLSRSLARARWAERDPVGALLLWQAVGLAGGLSLLGAGVTFGLAPLGDGLVAAARTVAGGGWPELSAARNAVLGGSLVLAVWLLGVLGVIAVRTVRARSRHRDLLDVLATPWPTARGAHVLDHPVPVAYCLPGPRSRLVVSAGAVATLRRHELDAVLAHEQAHLAERHDLVVLPFVAWGTTAPRVPGMVAAQRAVARLIEMRADDVAAARSDPGALAQALRSVAGGAEAAALTQFSAAVSRRLQRIESPPKPLPWPARLSVRAGAVALVVIPTVLLL